MDTAILIVVLLLFLGACIAAVVFTVKRRGWLAAVRGGTMGLFVTVLLFDSEQTRMKFALPLLGAVAVAWLWPYIVAQRKRERAQEIEPDRREEGTK